MIETAYDLLVVGGGINGVGIARDAAGRGLRVCLVERNDLGSATSSASSKLVHGGLRYLESYEFRLVRESLGERETLLRMAPHIVRPMRFVLPVEKTMRPAWMLRAGLFLYDHLAPRALLPATRRVDLRTMAQGTMLDGRFKTGFEYSDCWVDDARLVVLNAIDARERGADIRTRTECMSVQRNQTDWLVDLKGADGTTSSVRSRALVNAAGPWVEEMLGRMGSRRNASRVRLVKGSHLIFPRFFAGEHAYILQTSDGRVVFAIPYEGDFTLVGTTEMGWEPADGPPAISQAESDYLCSVINATFKTRLSPSDAVWSYAGVRPLYDDNQASATVVTRDYVFDLDESEGAPALSVFGGKLTTYRCLAESALDKLKPWFPNLAPAWTTGSHLPGGDFAPLGLAALTDDHSKRWPWLPHRSVARMTIAYGTRLERLIDTANGLSDLGQDHGAGLTDAEIAYLKVEEFAQTAEDILWRRSKLGLHGAMLLD